MQSLCQGNIYWYTHTVAVFTLHAKGSKHKERFPKDDQPVFFKPAGTTSTIKTKTIKPSELLLSKQTTITRCASETLTTNAEII